MKIIHTFSLAPLALGALLLTACGGEEQGPAAPGDPVPLSPNLFTWTETQRFPVAESLTAIDAMKGNAIATGSGGAILFRKAGEEWSTAARVVETQLKRVAMVDSKTAVAISNSQILQTTDAGNTWTVILQDLVNLSDVAARGKQVLVVGQATVARSTDGGRSWGFPAPVLPPVRFKHVAFLSDTQMVSVTRNGTMYRSTDSGTTWLEIHRPEFSTFYADLVFFDAQSGLAATRSAVLRTPDGGVTWKESINLAPQDIRNIEIVDAGAAFVLLRDGEILRTPDAGRSWIGVNRIPAGGTGLKLAALDDELMVVGDSGFSARSGNGGRDWILETRGFGGNFLGISFADASTAVAAFSSREDDLTAKALRSVDGGTTWTAVDPQMLRADHPVFAQGIGLMISSKQITRSTDDGASWTPLSTPTTAQLRPLTIMRDAAILDADTYLVCAGDGTLVRTTDGGASWTNIPLPVGPTSETVGLLAITFFSDLRTGLLVGEEFSFRTEDAGLTWTSINLNATAVTVVSDQVAVAAGTRILRSEDRGASWAVVEIPEVTLADVAFVDALHGIAVGGRGVILESVDGGLSWELRPRVTSLSLGTVAVRADGAALVGGSAGVVLLGK